MRSQPSSPLALVSRALVTERLDLVEGAGEGIDDTIYISIAGALVQQPRASRRQLRRSSIPAQPTRSRQLAALQRHRVTS